jgi:hypothetical protein
MDFTEMEKIAGPSLAIIAHDAFSSRGTGRYRRVSAATNARSSTRWRRGQGVALLLALRLFAAG